VTRQHGLQMAQGGHGHQEHKHSQGSHVLAGANRLESHEGDLHGEQQSEDIEGAVAGQQARGVPTHDEQHKDVQGDQVDDEHVASPRGDHVEV